MIPLNEIKTIYINETTFAKCQYSDPRATCFDAASYYGCVVFIETYPDGQIPVKGDKGIRKTSLEGYSALKEFYSPDYAALPAESNDFRRTLYWNPSISSDETGKVKIQFYNNSRCTNFSISAETVTPKGTIGVYQDE